MWEFDFLDPFQSLHSTLPTKEVFFFFFRNKHIQGRGKIVLTQRHNHNFTQKSW